MAKEITRRKAEMFSQLSQMVRAFRACADLEHTQGIEEIRAQVESGNEQASFNYKRTSQNILDDFEQEVQSIQSRAKKEHDEYLISQAKQSDDIKKEFGRIQGELRSLIDSFGSSCWEWESDEWDSYTVPRLTNSPKLIRVGYFNDLSAFSNLRLPAVLDLNLNKTIAVYSNKHAADSCSHFIQNMLFRVLVTHPPTLVKLHLVDPIGLGENFSWLDPKRNSACEAVLSDKKSIEDFLHKMALEITRRHNILDTTIEDYNESVKGHHLDYRFISLLDFPQRYTQQIVEDLIPIMRSGPTVGVYVIIHINNSKRPPDFWHWQDQFLSINPITFVVNPSHIDWNDTSFSRHKIKADDLPSTSLVASLLTKLSPSDSPKGAINILPYSEIAIAEREWGAADSTHSLTVPVGLDETGEPFNVIVGRQEGSVHHGIIAGTTGSGKGNLLRVLITQLLTAYSPEELELYLLDFKQSQDLGNYRRFPTKHIKALVGSGNVHSGVMILRWLLQEKGRRAEMYNTAVKLEEYRNITGSQLSRIVVIIDEFPKLLNDPQYGPESQELLAEIAKQGRAYGIHVFLSTQTLENYEDMRHVYGHMALRICLKVNDEADSEKILGHQNYAAYKLTETGFGIINQGGNSPEHSTKVKFAFLENSAQAEILKRIIDKYGKSSTVILGSNEASAISDNLQALRTASNTDNVSVFLGTSTELKPGSSGTFETDTYLTFSEEANSNLLLVGSKEDKAQQIFQSILVSLYFQRDKIDRVCLLLPPRTNLTNWLFAFFDVPDFFTRVNSPEDIKHINSIAQERLNSSGRESYKPLFLICFGLSRIPMLKDPLDNESASANWSLETVGSYVGKIGTVGPVAGIHSIIWSDTVKNVALLSDAHYTDISNYSLRAALPGLPPDDISTILELPPTAKVKVSKDYASCLNRTTDEFPERFLPYRLLSRDEVLKLIVDIDGV